MSNVRKDPAVEKQNQKEQSELQCRLSLENQSIRIEKQAGERAKSVAADLNTIVSILKSENAIPEMRMSVNQALVDHRHRASELGSLLNQLRLISRKLEDWQTDGFKKMAATCSELNPRDQKRLKAAIQAEQQTIMKHRTIHNIEKRISELHHQYVKHLKLSADELRHQNTQGVVYFLLQAQETEKESVSLLKRLKKMLKDLLRLTRAEIDLVKKLTA